MSDPDPTGVVYDIVPSILSRYAATALFVYDILISFADEVEYVWKSKWSSPKVLYFIVRYFGVAAAIFTSAISLRPQSI
ncbi:hypothetical protein DACRYDRAFT_21718, partial [Dacryopinax primogenitus]